ncbi:cysteine hydrolase [Candidatus Woesearchaeota archaeon]|nr:cysteine hydrolase [Candidatus Woesearchaeota archaeon]
MKVLLVIDMQKEGVKNLYKQNEVIKNISRLIDKFNSKKYKVVLVKVWITDPKNTSMTKLWPNEGIAGTEGAEIITELKGKPYDKVIKKTNYSAFYGTSLDSYLKKNKVKELYISGINTGCCILFTGVDAFYRGYDVFLVEDANSTSAGKARWQRGMREFQYFCGKLIKTRQLLRLLR